MYPNEARSKNNTLAAFCLRLKSSILKIYVNKVSDKFLMVSPKTLKSQKGQNIFKKLPKKRKFAKSGHTALARISKL